MQMLQEGDRSAPAFRPEAVRALPGPPIAQRKQPPYSHQVILLLQMVPSQQLRRTAILSNLQEVPPPSTLPGLARTTISTSYLLACSVRHI